MQLEPLILFRKIIKIHYQITASKCEETKANGYEEKATNN